MAPILDAVPLVFRPSPRTVRRPVLVAGFLVAGFLGGFPWAGPLAAQPAPSPEARSYLLSALDTIEATVMGDSADRGALRDSALAMIAGARSAQDTWGAIDWALRRANEHSFLQASPPGAVHELLGGWIGYLHVPQRGGAAVALADSLHGAVAELAAAGACGWIVDLRGNGGGNMWPMLAGVGPLLGDSLVGAFGTGPDAQGWFYRDGASGLRGPAGVEIVTRVTVPPVPLRPVEEPVAVLVDARTGSSGEALAAAFAGRPASRSFGTPTAGFATVNRGSRLPDGANMVVTTGSYTDRAGRVLPHRLEPDVVVEGLPAGWPFATDRVAWAARRWLEERIPCGGTARSPS